MCLLKTHEDRSRCHPRGDRAAAGQGRRDAWPQRRLPREAHRRSRCVAGSPASRAPCATTASRSGSPKRATRSRSWLRLRLLAAVVAAIRRCARCSAPTHSDWEKFDEIFDAYWRGRGMRSAQALSGGIAPARPHRAASREAAVARRSACRIASSAAIAEGDERRRPRPARRRIARREPRRRPTCATSPIRTSSRATHALAARLARTMRARLVRREQVRRRGRRLDLRRTIHRNVSHGGTPIELAWRRRKIKPLRLVVLLDASGSMELLHRLLRALPAWRGRCVPRGRSLRVPHPACACLASLRDRDVARAVDRLALMAQGSAAARASARALRPSIAGTRGA